MERRNEKRLGTSRISHIDFILIDLICLQAAFLIAYLIRFGGGNPYATPRWRSFAFVIEFIDLFLIFGFSPFDGILKRGMLKELIVLIKQTIALVAIVSLCLFAIKLGIAYSRLTIALMSGLYIGFAMVARKFWKAYLRKFARRNIRRQLLVGSGELAMRYARQIEEAKDATINIMGYIAENSSEEMKGYIGGINRLEELLAGDKADEVIIALDADQIAPTNEIINICEKYGVCAYVIPFYHDVMSATPSIEWMGNMKMVNLRSTPLDSVSNVMLKRVFDIFASLILILISSPFMLAAAIGTKLSSPGPILFRQERVGKGKKNFEMLKFRSMRVTDTETTGWSTNDDPRKTKFGSFIRKFSIDELPQFFNVLMGQMSLVGPRPEVPFHVNHFKDEIPLYLVRQRVSPGITGWAQVNGLRGDTSIEERVKYDIWYIENWSISLDLKIIWMTVFGGMVNQEKVKK